MSVWDYDSNQLPQDLCLSHCPVLCDQVLSGPVLMMSYDVTPIRWFLNQLSPHSMRVFWSSKRHKVSHSRCCFCCCWQDRLASVMQLAHVILCYVSLLTQ
jgi:hypothetical protein